MITNLTKEDLIKFEEEIADCFNKKQIRAPIHLYFGNENELIKVFKDIEKDDWVLCSWRSHYQVLLKGVPAEKLKRDILDGKSISLCYPEYRIFSSAIVTGSLPIAVGIALDIKRSNGKNKVYVFCGDMTSETGMFHECLKYSMSHELPIKFIIEDNGVSVCTNTRKTWNIDVLFAEKAYLLGSLKDYLYYYKYKSKYPHSGAGERIQF